MKHDQDEFHDEDLNPVLRKATNEELDVIHDILMKKWSETLSIEDDYREHYPNHQEYTHLIAKEIRDFGGNSIANVFRGEGPPYLEIVCDVAKAVGAPFNRAHPIDEIEASILATILSKAFEKMPEAERLALLDEIGKPNLGALTAGSAITFLAIFNAGGSASYKLMLIVVNGVVKGVIGRGLSWAADAALVRVMGIATGPVGWALASLLTFIQIAAPSYKVTIPCVAYVAMLRKAQRTLRCTKCEAVVDGGFRFCPKCGEKIGAAS